MKINLRNNYQYNILIIILLSTLFLHSCYKDRLGINKIKGGEWNPKMAVPLIYGDLTMMKLVNNSADKWRTDPDGLLSLIYTGDTLSDFGDQIFTIPDQSSDTTLPFVIPPNMFPGDSTSRIIQISSEFHPSGHERVDSILIKSGVLTIEVTSNMNHSGYIEITIPQMNKYGNGATFKEKIFVPYTGGASTTVSKSFPLYDYFLRINTNGSTANKIDEYVKIFVKRGNGSNNSPYAINIKQRISSLTFHQAFGYFYQHTITVNQTKIPISIFDNLHYSQIFIENPKLKLSFRNNYGMPMEMTFTALYVDKNGVKKDVTSTLLPTMSLNYPHFDRVGESDTTNFIFDKNNSNIIDIINFNPKKLIYSGSILSNPTNTMIPNFVMDSSHVSISAELEIPLYGRALDFTLNDTSKVDMSKLLNWNNLVSVDINLNALNYFPMESQLQVYLADSNKVVYDSLFDGVTQIVAAAIPGPPPAYRVSIPAHKLSSIKLSNERLNNFKKAQYLIVSSASTTYDQGSKVIKIYSDYKISMEISAKGEYKTNY